MHCCCPARTARGRRKRKEKGDRRKLPLPLNSKAPAPYPSAGGRAAGALDGTGCRRPGRRYTRTSLPPPLLHVDGQDSSLFIKEQKKKTFIRWSCLTRCAAVSSQTFWSTRTPTQTQSQRMSTHACLPHLSCFLLFSTWSLHATTQKETFCHAHCIPHSDLFPYLCLPPHPPSPDFLKAGGQHAHFGMGGQGTALPTPRAAGMSSQGVILLSCLPARCLLEMARQQPSLPFWD